MLIRTAQSQRINRNLVFLVLATLILFASPWFVRNALLSGDPIDPILNLATRHADPFWTFDDFNGQRSDLHRGVFAGAVPILAFFNRPEFIDGVSLSFCFLYIPFITAAVLLLNKKLRKAQPALAILTTVVTFSICQELIATDWLIRYTLHFYPVFVALLIFATWLFCQNLAERFRSKAQLFSTSAIIVAVLFLIPSIGSSYTYDATISGFKNLGFGVDRPEAYLSSAIPTYVAATRLSDVVNASGTGATVLTLNYEYLAYYFRNKGITQIGDWFGPGRVHDFVLAIDDRKLPDYLQKLGVGAVMFPRAFSTLSIGQQEELIAALKKDKFIDVSEPGDQVLEFVRVDVLDRAGKHGDALGETDLGYPIASAPLAIQSCGLGNRNRADSFLVGRLKSSQRYMKMTTRLFDRNGTFVANPSVMPFEPFLWPAITMNWVVPGAKKTEVKVAKQSGVTFGFGNSNGSATTGYWVSLGSRFFLEDTTARSPGRLIAVISADECSY